MKIAYLTADFGVPVFGTKGASIHVHGIASNLSKLGHQVLVLTPRAGDVQGQKGDFDLVEIPPGGGWPEISEVLKEEEICHGNRLRKDLRNLHYNAWLEAKGGEILRSFQPACIYERYSLFGTAGVRLAHSLNIPLILEVNAPLVEEQKAQRGLSLPKAAADAQRRIFSQADHIIVVSRWLEKYVVNHGASSEKVTILPNGADPETFFPDCVSTARSELGWKDKFVIGYVGTMKDWHGLPSVISSLNPLCKRHRDIRILMVGDGPERPALQLLIDQSGLQEHVHITGLVPHEDVPVWINAMDLALVPFSEKAAEYFSPVKLFEYMAMKRPVLAGRISQTAEMIEEGETGWLYSPGNGRELEEKIERLKADRPKLNQVAERAYLLAKERYTWKHNAERVVEIILKSC